MGATQNIATLVASYKATINDWALAWVAEDFIVIARLEAQNSKTSELHKFYFCRWDI